MNINGFVNIRNSCYMDCVLVVLLFERNGYMCRYLNNNKLQNKMKDTLQHYYKKVHSGTKTSHTICEFRKMCLEMQQSTSYPPFHDDDPQDAEEFLQFIMNEFFKDTDEGKILTVKKTKIYIDSIENIRHEIEETINDLPMYAILPCTQSSIVEDADESRMISLQKLLLHGEYIQHSNQVIVEKGHTFDMYLQQRVIENTPFVFITLQRIGLLEPTFTLSKKRQKVLPEEYISFNETDSLKLVSIIAHIGCATGGHYVAFLNKENVWYVYDDMFTDELFKQIGTYEDLINLEYANEKNIVLTTSTIFSYQHDPGKLP